MTNAEILAILSKVRPLCGEPRVYAHRGEPTPFPLACRVFAPVSWDLDAVERAFAATLPDDLQDLWHEAGELRLFEDRTYGQWGLVIWPPSEVVDKNTVEMEERSDQFRLGDVLVGEFLGDAERLLVRCDPTQDDFGRVMIALPADPRADWPAPARSLSQFLHGYIEAQGDKFWEASTASGQA